MATNHNPRGFAYTTFAGGYRVAMRWNWGQIARSTRRMPNQYEWVRDAMLVWERMSVGIDVNDVEQVRTLAQSICKYLLDGDRQQVKGVMRREVKTDFIPFTTEYTNTVDNSEWTGSRYDGIPEEGYAAFEDRQALTIIMETLAGYLPEDDLWVLAEHVVNGEPLKLLAAERGIVYTSMLQRFKRLRKNVAITSLLEVYERK